MTGMRLSMPLQALRQGHAEWTIGVLMALFALFPVLLALPAGRMADRHGYHRPVRLAALLSLAGALVATASSHFVAMGVAAALCGAGSSFGMIAVQRTAGRMAADATERMRVFSWVALAPALASLVGPLGAGLLIDTVGFQWAFAALCLLPVGTLLCAQRVSAEHRSSPLAMSGQRRPAWELLRSGSFRRLLFVNWVVSASWDVHGFALPILGHELGLSASAIGAVLAAYAVTSMLVRLAIPLLAHLLSQRVVMGAALALAASAFALYPLLGTVGAMALCAGVLGLALGSVQPVILSTLHQLTPQDRQGEALALRSMAIHGSGMAMPLLFGALGAVVGAASLFWLMAAALGLGSAQALRLPTDRAGVRRP